MFMGEVPDQSKKSIGFGVDERTKHLLMAEVLSNNKNLQKCYILHIQDCLNHAPINYTHEQTQT